ncbi:MAG TPA: hypothetical protein VD865_02850 [Stenotrophomonas sp.]|nr:hypothetical protein [Stenotrophomonas sp.]
MSLIIVNATPSRIDIAVDTGSTAGISISKMVYVTEPNLLFAARGDRFFLGHIHHNFFYSPENVSFDEALEFIPEIGRAQLQHMRDMGAAEGLEVVMAGFSSREREMAAYRFRMLPGEAEVQQQRMWNDFAFWASPWQPHMGECPGWKDEASLKAMAAAMAAELQRVGAPGGGRLKVASITADGCRFRDAGEIA